MSKAELVDIIKKNAGCTSVKAKKTVDALFGGIVKTLKKDGSLGIVGFGTFKVSRRGARKGRNPKTGEVIKIGASKSVRFKASKGIRASL
ncbi:MAG: HU family DNA-binding protein [Proteobacteria bacterium]|jgi:DNA-binding protein HU-beta|nr:HU family DNA-binding protein [Pseudomonadota bacterium]